MSIEYARCRPCDSAAMAPVPRIFYNQPQHSTALRRQPRRAALVRCPTRVTRPTPPRQPFTTGTIPPAAAPSAPVPAPLLKPAASTLPKAPVPAATVGIALTLVACALFSVMDGTTRIAGQVLPLLMVLWVRLLVQALVTSALVLPRYGLAALRTAHPKFQCTRALLGCMTSGFVFSAS